MSSDLIAGVRNVPAFMAEVRDALGFSREIMGRFIGLSAREVYWIEMGRIPPDQVVERLKVLLLIAPAITLLSSILSNAVTWVLVQRQWLKWQLQGKVDRRGQLRLPLK